jgi:hypothetical protein
VGTRVSIPLAIGQPEKVAWNALNHSSHPKIDTLELP